MRRLLRNIRRSIAVVCGLIVLAAALIAGALWATLPRADQDARIPGLSAPVTVGFDADGVPRIEAQNAADVAAALGFVHARDRMFQMEMLRRAASGRLSEVAGPATLGLDKMMRTLGIRRRAVEQLGRLAPETRAMLDAYAAGVNAWIALRGRFAGAEFLALGAPEPWTPADSLLWGKTLALWLSGNWQAELSRQRLAGKLPPEMIEQLWPRRATPASPSAAREDPAAARLAALLQAALPRFPDPFTLPDEASNEWAVAAGRSATGAPLLAGDPHLGFSMPGIWYLARIDTPDGVLAGATSPGVPFLVIGRNSRIAWTFTTTGADTEDLFVESAAPGGGYQTPDGPRPFETHEERIAVRGQPDVTLTVRETRHGPLISDILKDDPDSGGRDAPLIAVQMAALAEDDTAADGLVALGRAQSAAQAGEAAPRISAPVQNLLVADRDHIAMFTTGRVPIRRAGDGSAPVDGADGAHDWTGWASGDALPHSVDPPSGRLVNANEPTAGPDFPVLISRDGFGDWRARRIRELLDATGRHTPEDFSRMQVDTVSLYARELLPSLTAIQADGLAGKALDLLRGWDGDMVMGAPQPLIWNAWLDRFRDDVEVKAGVSGVFFNRLEWTELVLSPQGAAWCGGDCAPMLLAALRSSTAELARRWGDEPSAWRWGPAHQAIFAHPILGRLPLVGPLTTSTIDSPGDDTTVDRGGMRQGSLDSVHGASFRGVYDLADLDRSLFVVAPGQSGNPVSGRARSFVRRWRDGDVVTLRRLDGPPAATIRLSP